MQYVKGNWVRVSRATAPVVVSPTGRTSRPRWGQVVESSITMVTLRFPGYPHLRDYGVSEVERVVWFDGDYQPTTLVRWALAHNDQVDGVEYDPSCGYWVYLRSGYCSQYQGHLLQGVTIEEVRDLFRAVRPCTCDLCSREVTQ